MLPLNKNGIFNVFLQANSIFYSFMLENVKCHFPSELIYTNHVQWTRDKMYDKMYEIKIIYERF